MPRSLSTASFQFSKRFVDHRNDVKNQVVKTHGKWPDEPIKALGVYFTYDQKLLNL